MSNAFTSDKSKKVVYQWKYACANGHAHTVKQPLMVQIACGRCGTLMLFVGPVTTFE